jgi:hypothetical protein
MTESVWWYVLAGFLIGFILSTLWEWLYFRHRRMRIESRRIAELEATVRSLTPARDASASPISPTAASGYQGPGVFLENERMQTEQEVVITTTSAVVAEPPKTEQKANERTLAVTQAPPTAQQTIVTEERSTDFRSEQPPVGAQHVMATPAQPAQPTQLTQPAQALVQPTEAILPTVERRNGSMSAAGTQSVAVPLAVAAASTAVALSAERKDAGKAVASPEVGEEQPPDTPASGLAVAASGLAVAAASTAVALSAERKDAGKAVASPELEEEQPPDTPASGLAVAASGLAVAAASTAMARSAERKDADKAVASPEAGEEQPPDTLASGVAVSSTAAEPGDTVSGAPALSSFLPVVSTVANGQATQAQTGTAGVRALPAAGIQPGIQRVSGELDSLAQSLQGLLDTADPLLKGVAEKSADGKHNGSAAIGAYETQNMPSLPVTGPYAARNLSRMEYTVVRLMQSARQAGRDLRQLWRQ